MQSGNIESKRPDLLIEARYKLTKTQNDIIDYVLSKIEDDTTTCYRLELSEFMDLYNSPPDNLYRNIKNAIKKMETGESAGFRIFSGDKEHYYHWFSYMGYVNKKGAIEVELGLKLKQLLLDMKRWIKYDIKYTLNLSSAYSQRLYYLLKLYEDTGWREDSIEDLVYKLGCSKSYYKPSKLESRVLDIAKKEINETTDITFEYTIIKIKNSSRVKFSIKRKNNINYSKASAHDINKETDTDIKRKLDITRKILENCTTNEGILKSVLKEANYDLSLVDKLYKVAKVNSTVNTIGYLRALIRNHNNTSTLKTNNYTGRNYSKEELKRIENGLRNKVDM